MPNYTLGRGQVFFDPFVPGTLNRTGERYLGNTPEFNINIASELLDHFNSDEGVRTKDDSVTLEITRSGSLIVDDISADNLALFLLGNRSTHSQASGSGVTSTFTDVYRDRWYQLGQTASNPGGDRNVSAVTVTAPAGLVLGTDFTVDLVLGRIYLTPTAASIVDGTTDLTVTYTRPAESRSLITTSSLVSAEGALRFIARNPKGLQNDFYMPYVKLTPNGDFALKGDEWQQIPLNVEILLLNSTTQALYVNGRVAA